jgi:hypothetical protein
LLVVRVFGEPIPELLLRRDLDASQFGNRHVRLPSMFQP